MSSITRTGWVALAAVVLLAAGCSDGGERTDSGNDALTQGKNSVATLTTACDSSKPFNAPVLVAGFDDRPIFSFRPSADETSAVLSVMNSGSEDLFFASRASTAAPFVIGSAITELNSPSAEYWPSLSADGEMIYFESDRPLTPGGPTHDRARIWAATRSSTTSAFGAPKVLHIFADSTNHEAAPYLHANGQALYFSSISRGTTNTFDLFVANLTDFGVVTSVEGVASTNVVGEENMPVVSSDERAMFFSRWIGTARDVFVVGRSSTGEPVGIAQQVVEVTSTNDDFPSAISTDGCRLYLISDRPVAGVQRHRVWVAEKPL
jgi:hypothetical protein